MSASNISHPSPASIEAMKVNAARQSSASTSQWVGPIAGMMALAAICTWLFWDYISKQVHYAVNQQADWGHTLVIPVIAAYFVFVQRDKLLARPFKTTWFGLLVMSVGVGLYMLCTAGPLTLRHHNLQGTSVAVAITGIVLLFCGWRAMRWLTFPLIYAAVFSQTISERLLTHLTYELQDITAKGAALLLSLFLDVDRLGNTIYIVNSAGTSIPLNIAEACSGMRMLMAFLALGTAMAFTGLKYPWQRVLLVAMGVPTAIFVNILRVCTLGVLSLSDAQFAAGDFHSFIGLLWLIPAFILYLIMMWIITHLVVEEK